MNVFCCNIFFFGIGSFVVCFVMRQTSFQIVILLCELSACESLLSSKFGINDDCIEEGRGEIEN